MPCLSSDDGTVHICMPTIVRMEIKRQLCPTCKKKRFMLSWFEEWYGWSHVCLKCGERWSCGGREERPFCRGWRKDSVERAKKSWRRYQKLLMMERNNG